MEKIRNEEGSSKRIYYPGIRSEKSQAQGIKPKLIIWKSYFSDNTELKNPFYFQNGQTATNILDLLSFCVDPNYSEECIKHLTSGHFAEWLSYIEETELADTTKNLTSPSQTNKNEDLKLLSKFVHDCYITLYQYEEKSHPEN